MKSIYYFIVAFFPFVIFGCSSTYTINDFSSKEMFYDDFNNFASGKSLNVELTNDSSITVSNGFILNDTLYMPGFRIDKKSGKIVLSDIKKIDYTGGDYKSANLLMKNGSQISIEEINVANDTLNYTNSKKIITQDAIMPLVKIKEARYKNRWFSTPAGFLSGGIIGAYIGSKFPFYRHHTDMANTGRQISEPDYATGGFIGLGSGAVIGAVVGYLIGYTYIYQFNP